MSESPVPRSTPTPDPASAGADPDVRAARTRDRVAKAVILTVDDDPSVSRAVARDLRRRYGAGYRIMRADSGADALQVIREVVLRGEQVAVILADYRMPGMNGVDFLEAAMDLAPSARRALLTAYADTTAAIAAINVVDVDHYLLKPWEPPEEKFYPVVDELLATWAREARAPEHKVKILGHPWSAQSYEVRDFLARNLVPYRWYTIEDPDGARLLAAAGAEPGQVPVVITSEGEPMVRPSLFDLANAVGLSTAPEGDFYDVVVIGGGPAGLGAAVYAASEGLKVRGQLSPAGRRRSRRPGGARGLLRLGRHPGRVVPGRPRRHRGWGQLGRSGGGLLLSACGPGQPGGPG